MAEACFRLHPQVVYRHEDIASITIATSRSTVRSVDVTGPLSGPAQRSRCLQYVAAVALLYGTLTPEHYMDSVAGERASERV